MRTCDPLFKCVEIDAFIFQGSPEPLDHPVIDPATFAIHGYPDVDTPDLIWSVNCQFPQQIWINLVLRMFLAGVWCLAYWHQTHEPHQLAHTVAATFVALTLHIPRHLL